MARKKKSPGPAAPHPLLRGLMVANTLALAGLLVLAFGFQGAFFASFQEDTWGEWGTFHAFALASALGLWGALKAWREGAEDEQRLPRAIMLAGLAAFCFLVAGEEISWGQRLLGFAPPEIFLQHNYQQELNFHNFLKTIAFDVKWLVAGISFFYGITWAFLAKEPALQKSRWGRAIASQAPPVVLTPWHLGVILWIVVFPMRFSDEVAELLLGLVFVGDLALRVLPREMRKPRVGAIAAGLVIAPVLFGALTTPIADTLTRRHEEARTAQMQGELPELGADLEKARRGEREPALIHARLYSVMEQDALEWPEAGKFARARGESNRGRYFLDPWNNPYWLYARADSDVVLVYSFGPNRRRDASAEELGAAAHGAPGEMVTLTGDDAGFRARLGQ